jgi:hypothetical protein
MKANDAGTLADSLAIRCCSWDSNPGIFVAFSWVAVFILAVLFTAASAGAAENVHEDDMDRSIKPGADFYRYANGGWLHKTTIPPGQSSYDTRAWMAEKTSARVRALIEGAAAARLSRDVTTKKVGDYYTSFIDTDSIEARKLTPLASGMAVISGIRDKASKLRCGGRLCRTHIRQGSIGAIRSVTSTTGTRRMRSPPATSYI